MLEEGCYFMRKNCPELVKTVDNNLAQSCMRLIDCYLKKYIETEVKKTTPDQIEQLSQQIKSIFMFSFLWSVGGTTDLIGRGRFDKWLRERMAKHSIAFPEDK